jgi:hypothetical protein
MKYCQCDKKNRFISKVNPTYAPWNIILDLLELINDFLNGKKGKLQ